MRSVHRVILCIRVALSITSLVVPIAVVTYPSGDSDSVGAWVLLLYLLPGSLPYATSNILAFVGITLLTGVVVAAPLIPYLIRLTILKRCFARDDRNELALLIAATAMSCLFVAGYAIQNPPYTTTRLFGILFGLILMSLVLEAAVIRAADAKRR